MEDLVELLLALLGGGILILLFGLPALSVLGLVFAYLRYHLLGVETPILTTLLYRASRGETLPPPSPWKGIALIGCVVGAVFWSFW